MQDISRAFAMCSFAVSLNQHTPISSPRGLRDLRKRVGLSRFSLNQSVSSFSQTSSWLERMQGARSHAAAWNMPKDTFDADQSWKLQTADTLKSTTTRFQGYHVAPVSSYRQFLFTPRTHRRYLPDAFLLWHFSHNECIVKNSVEDKTVPTFLGREGRRSKRMALRKGASVV